MLASFLERRLWGAWLSSRTVSFHKSVRPLDPAAISLPSVGMPGATPLAPVRTASFAVFMPHTIVLSS
eukprot:COSAG01_NODE_6072_length_3867_cov_176.980626_2_plen_68_part_00